MNRLDPYKIGLINEINSYKTLLIDMGFECTEELNVNNYDEYLISDLEDFYSEIMGYIELHNYRAKNYPHTSGR
jgi:hypothetical protein